MQVAGAHPPAVVAAGASDPIFTSTARMLRDRLFGPRFGSTVDFARIERDLHIMVRRPVRRGVTTLFASEDDRALADRRIEVHRRLLDQPGVRAGCGHVRQLLLRGFARLIRVHPTIFRGARPLSSGGCATVCDRIFTGSVAVGVSPLSLRLQFLRRILRAWQPSSRRPSAPDIGWRRKLLRLLAERKGDYVKHVDGYRLAVSSPPHGSVEGGRRGHSLDPRRARRNEIKMKESL